MASAEDDLEAVVIDNGTWMCKAGYAGDKTAHVYERTIIGRGKTNMDSQPSEFIGEKACLQREFLQLTNPMCRGAVVDWDTMERYWDYIFHQKLRAGIEGRPVMITEIPGVPADYRRQMTEILFEKFSTLSLYVSNPAYLALLASGRATGAVLEVGGSVAHTTVVIRGSELQLCNRRSDIGGDDVTDWLASILNTKGVAQGCKSTEELHVAVDDFKHYLTSSLATRPSPPSCCEYLFPDGACIQIDDQFALYTDVLFNPALAGLQATSIDQILHETLSSCPPEYLSEICSNIIIAGGATMFADVAENMASALKRHDLAQDLKIVAPPERRKSAWLGGSILASLDEFPKLCKSRETYYENGWREFLTFDESETIKQADS